MADVATRVLDTHGTLEEVRARVDAALADALARRRRAARAGGGARAGCSAPRRAGRRPGPASPPGGSGQAPR
jgi:hypothetical protein